MLKKIEENLGKGMGFLEKISSKSEIDKRLKRYGTTAYSFGADPLLILGLGTAAAGVIAGLCFERVNVNQGEEAFTTIMGGQVLRRNLKPNALGHFLFRPLGEKIHHSTKAPRTFVVGLTERSDDSEGDLSNGKPVIATDKNHIGWLVRTDFAAQIVLPEEIAKKYSPVYDLAMLPQLMQQLGGTISKIEQEYIGGLTSEQAKVANEKLSQKVQAELERSIKKLFYSKELAEKPDTVSPIAVTDVSVTITPSEQSQATFGQLAEEAMMIGSFEQVKELFPNNPEIWQTWLTVRGAERMAEDDAQPVIMLGSNGNANAADVAGAGIGFAARTNRRASQSAHGSGGGIASARQRMAEARARMGTRGKP